MPGIPGWDCSGRLTCRSASQVVPSQVLQHPIASRLASTGKGWVQGSPSASAAVSVLFSMRGECLRNPLIAIRRAQRGICDSQIPCLDDAVYLHVCTEAQSSACAHMTNHGATATGASLSVSVEPDSRLQTLVASYYQSSSQAYIVVVLDCSARHRCTVRNICNSGLQAA
jgi:hypothetical protein